VNNEIKPYQFEPMDVSGYSDSEEDSSESETDISDKQVSQNAWVQWIGVSAWNAH